MADNKQYINQSQENGNIMISEDVVATIVAQSVKEVESAVSLSVKPGADIADMIGKKNWGRGIKILIEEDNSVTPTSKTEYPNEGPHKRPLFHFPR